MNTRQDLLPILQAVRAYVPRLILEQVLAAPDVEQAGREERFAGAVLFADVSGFTAMSESLAQLGKEGAEELTRVLNRYFSTMIEIVEQFDGQVIKFGGDAITCAFISDDAQGEGVLRAGACGLAMAAGRSSCG
ncbi:MAG TPA: adenylate/guanylate cyclase domain-containing protein [Anaerolineae bacterium]|nr:adenylate/guanylate cyclase domain-containing protein [Anaerolineae bacterium]